GDLRKDLLCKSGKLEAYVVTNEIIDDELALVRVKFDNAPAMRQTWNRSQDYKAIFAPNARQFVAALNKSSMFLLEYRPYERMPETITLHVEGLKDALAAPDMDLFLRKLTREVLIRSCGPAAEE